MRVRIPPRPSFQHQYRLTSSDVLAMRVEQYTAPIPPDLALALSSLWQQIFQSDYESRDDILKGKEKHANKDTLYVARQDGKIVGTSCVTSSLAEPRIGGLGYVATHPEYRRRGIGRILCARAAEEFEAAGGQALFLGSANPLARQLYEQLDWQGLANSNVMVRLAERIDPEAFLDNYFTTEQGLDIAIVRGDCAGRITIIPVILATQQCCILDANVELFSRRIKLQKSCMGLYPRYQAIEDCGAWFAATRADGAVVGLASVQWLEANIAQVDAFSHPNWHQATTDKLYQHAIDWAHRQAAATVRAVCATDDALKLSVLKQLKMCPTGGEIQIGQAEDSITARVFEMP